jgi:hypothetical protein
MGRKSKQEKDLQAYWDAKLKKEGLSVGRGQSKRVSYVGGNKGLEAAADIKKGGRASEWCRLQSDDKNISPSEFKSYKPNVPKKT